jgi:5-methylcytosine-specific restriction endonuclease McrA
MNKKEENRLAARTALKMMKKMEVSQSEMAGRSVYAVVIPKAVEILGKQYSGSARKFILENISELNSWVGDVKVVPRKKRVAKTKITSKDVDKSSFLQSYAWRKVRMIALKRYGPKCQCCGATPSTGAVMNVDHIKPRKLFPSLALDVNNLQILCNACNHGKGNWDMTDWR